MRAATLFSGIGAPEAAMPHWQWLWHAEIEKFPSAVMAQRHPQSVNLGDVTADDFTQRAEAIGRPDILVFGSPCQSFSVAGKRLGLDDPRGNLALVALGIVDRLKPRWFVFENVPGLMSSDSGRDFGTFIGLVDELRYSLCWARLDAQHFGVAQRRERVFAVGHLGDWRYPAAILLEPESLCGNHPPRREAGQRPAPTIASCPTGGGGLGTDFDCDGGLIAGTLGTRSAAHPSGTKAEADFMVAFGGNNTEGLIDVATACRAKGGSGHGDFESETFIAHALRADGFDASEDGTGRGTPIIPILEVGARTGKSTDDIRAGIGIGEPGDPMFTLQSGKQHGIAFKRAQIGKPYDRTDYKPGVSGTLSQYDPECIAFSSKDHGADAQNDLSPTLRSGNHDKSHANAGVPPAVAFQTRIARNGRGQPEEIAPALSGADAGATSDMRPCIATSSAVRRLTPRECERLQSFPDDYTLIRYRGKPAADGPRYKSLGNSMNMKVIRHVLTRIETFERDVRPVIERAA